MRETAIELTYTVPSELRRCAQAGLWTCDDQAGTTRTGDPGGVKFFSEGGGAYLRWRAVEQIVPSNDGLPLWTTPKEVMVPLSGQPAGQMRETVLENFDTWRTSQ